MENATLEDLQVPNDPAMDSQDQYLEEELKMLEFQQAKTELDNLLSRWEVQKQYAAVARRTRFIDVNVEQLQQQGVLKSDETLIPCRVIDSNIRKEQPAYINFLINSRRLITFKDSQDYTANTQRLEDEFTSGMRYECWEMPFFKEIDGAQTFGWDAIEVEYDLDKPLHCGINHLGNENLLFPIDSKDIQGSEIIAIRYEFTRLVLRRFVNKYGFIKARVDELLDAKDGKQIKNIEIYKVYLKVAGIVYVAWFARSGTGWLKDPEPLYLGRNRRVEIPADPSMVSLAQLGLVPAEAAQPTVSWEPEYETQYPVRLLIYNVSEQPCLTNNRGRVFLDQTKQESQTAMMSSLINGCIRASNLYGCLDQGDAEGGAPRQLDTEMVHGRIFNKKINWFNTPWPDAMLLKASQALDTQTQTETGQINFAVNNRQDSRKTATEIDAAQQQSMLLSSVQVSLFSNHIQEVYSLAWSIVQSQALQGKISFLQNEVQGMMGMEKVNDVDKIGRVYIIKAAGDVDVIERDERLKQMLAFWPVIATTPLAMTYLMDIMRLAHPEDAMRYNAILEQGDVAKNLLGQVANVLKTAVTNDDGSIKPEFATHAKEFAVLQQQIEQVLAGDGQEQQNIQGQQAGPAQAT